MKGLSFLFKRVRLVKACRVLAKKVEISNIKMAQTHTSHMSQTVDVYTTLQCY